ncbi:hypothetical protein L228DRAFT_269189 [Xylona heveae TC161]|uniref:polynucleotide adenylyltransferase n=1 Tax=Xylona heveae (strain CBS 132557 / TC161) TaxID=1328760 RepID=A0A165G4N4_XYLHT|nr:hypothetical protein L228DRAFT_269189 [Xylona heveae TC161]KZF21734.1 hypothetical protein L228DRAFT_269189 [Xylona heveae TC161]
MTIAQLELRDPSKTLHSIMYCQSIRRIGRCQAPNSFQPLSALCSVLGIHNDFCPRFLKRHATSVSEGQTSSLESSVAEQGSDGPGNSKNVSQKQRRRRHKKQDIFVDSLEATLAAHRATNRASIIKKIPSSNKRPALSQASAAPTPQKIIEDTQVKVAQRSGKGSRSRFAKKHHRLAPRQPVTVLNTRIAPFNGSLEKYGTPWLAHLKINENDGFARLDAEIEAFDSYMSLTNRERLAREELQRMVQSDVQTFVPNCVLNPSGSSVTGLALPLSDLDFQLGLPKEEDKGDDRGPSARRPEIVKRTMRRLQGLAAFMRNTGRYEDLAFHGFRIPIINGTHRATGLSIQITATDDSIASQEYVRNYLAEFPAARPLQILLKSALNMRGLSEVYQGGLGSYSLFMMVVAGLKLNPLPREHGYLAKQLLHFLQFWSELDCQNKGVSVDPPGIFEKRDAKQTLSKREKEAAANDPIIRGQLRISCRSESQPFLLCLQDPANEFNDLGFRSYKFEAIQIIFQGILRDLRKSMDAFEQHATTSAREVSLLQKLVGGDYDDFEARRQRVSKYRF